ncbi:MAG TPA: paraquat-inducible protein A [Burkholderiales bacterium]|nr:paraquat-inducible protein A [Burkholderiales bacterium]
MANDAKTVACATCGLVQRVNEPPAGFAAECARCGGVILERRVAGPEVTAALTLAALILYIPANVYPILRMSYYGAYSENTVWDGVVALARQQEWLVAAVVFLASIVVPLVKLAVLFFLVASARARSTRWQRLRTSLYRFIDVIGPWAMLDVFLLAILVALVKMGEIATVLPGPGLLAFAGVVILTIVASASFDPRLIWN